MLSAGSEELEISEGRFAGAVQQQLLYETIVVAGLRVTPFGCFVFECHPMDKGVLSILSKDQVESARLVFAHFGNKFGNRPLHFLHLLRSHRVFRHRVFHNAICKTELRRSLSILFAGAGDVASLFVGRRCALV